MILCLHLLRLCAPAAAARRAHLNLAGTPLPVPAVGPSRARMGKRGAQRGKLGFSALPPSNTSREGGVGALLSGSCFWNRFVTASRKIAPGAARRTVPNAPKRSS
jgi:hypothetical protein